MSPATFSAHCAKRSACVTMSRTGVRSVCHARGASSSSSQSAATRATCSLMPSRSPMRPPICTGKRVGTHSSASSGALQRSSRNANVVSAAGWRNDRAWVGIVPNRSWRWSVRPGLRCRDGAGRRCCRAPRSSIAVSTTSWVVSLRWRCSAALGSSRERSTSSSGSTGVPAAQPSARTSRRHRLDGSRSGDRLGGRLGDVADLALRERDRRLDVDHRGHPRLVAPDGVHRLGREARVDAHGYTSKKTVSSSPWYRTSNR